MTKLALQQRSKCIKNLLVCETSCFCTLFAGKSAKKCRKWQKACRYQPAFLFLTSKPSRRPPSSSSPEFKLKKTFLVLALSSPPVLFDRISLSSEGEKRGKRVFHLLFFPLSPPSFLFREKREDGEESSRDYYSPFPFSSSSSSNLCLIPPLSALDPLVRCSLRQGLSGKGISWVINRVSLAPPDPSPLSSPGISKGPRDKKSRRGPSFYSHRTRR